MSEPGLDVLQMKANAVVTDLFIGRPGMESTIKGINTTQGYEGNLKLAVDDTVESIMANSANGPEAVKEALNEFEQAADAAASIYDEVHEVALEAFQDHPELMDELSYMIDSSMAEMTPELMANEIAGDIASQIWNSGNYASIEEFLKDALDDPDALDSNIHTAKQAAEAFIEKAQNYSPDKTQEATNEASGAEYASQSPGHIIASGGDTQVMCQGNGKLTGQAMEHAGGPEIMVQTVEPDTGNVAAPKTAAECATPEADKSQQPQARQGAEYAKQGPDIEPALG
jgi:hypothetical protein